MTRSPQTATDDYHHGDLPRALLGAVEAIISEKGIRGVSLREAARRAGVSHSAPAHHFGDKDGLLAAFAQQGFAGLERDLRSAVVATHDRAPMEQMAELGRAYIRFAVAHPAHFEVMFRADLDKSGHEELHDQAKATFAALEDRVVVLQEAGYYADAPPEAVAMYFWSLAHGMASLWVDGQIEGVFDEVDATRLDEITSHAVALASRGADKA